VRCENCPHVARPFNWCSMLGQPLDDGKTRLLGCNIDGKMDWTEDEKRV